MDSKEVDALVIGAGFGGLYQVYRLREAGFNVQGVDAAPEVGGTWYWNCYPGARVDSPSYTYQYWFSKELLADWEWSQRYPPQPELERYLNHVADRFDLRKHFLMNTRVERADWNDAINRWQVTTNNGDQFNAQHLICCSGILNEVQVPPFAGHEKFRGRIVHSARWPREGLSLAGKRVAVIGTGATGIQIIQALAPEVEHLTVFQRTPPYGVKMRNPQFDDAARAELRARYPELHAKVHNTSSGFEFEALLAEGEWYTLTPEQKKAALEQVWADGSLAFWVGVAPETGADPEVNAEVADFVREKIRARVNDPAIAEKLMPKTPFGIARVPLENGFYEVFNRDNVTLVDVNESPIEHFTETGLVAGGEEHPVDVVIMATGFNAATGSLTAIDINGRDGKSLKQLWGEDIRSTLGLQVHGFPNMFTIPGPLSPGAALCNAATCLQQQVDWVTDCVKSLRDNHKLCIEPSLEKENAWIDHHEEIVAMTLFPQSQSWYMGTNVSGKPRRLLAYAGGVGEYKRLCDEVVENGYAGFEMR